MEKVKVRSEEVVKVKKLKNLVSLFYGEPHKC